MSSSAFKEPWKGRLNFIKVHFVMSSVLRAALLLPISDEFTYLRERNKRMFEIA